MKRKKIRNIVIILVAIGLIAGLATGYYLYNKPPEDVAGMKPEYTLSAGELTEAFNTNEKEANDKYAGKVIQVAGEIAEIEGNDSTMTFILTAENDPGSGVSCTLASEALEEAKGYSIGELVAVKGKCTGKLFEVVLINCHFVNKS